MKEKILIVDDSALIHQMYGKVLEDEGFEVIHAFDGVMAINTVFSEMPDLILLDINMPKINGYQVCRLLKDHPVTKDIPIIIETSRTSAAPVADPKMWSFETGADGYIDKEEGTTLVEFFRPYLERRKYIAKIQNRQKPMTEIEIMTALSRLLDKHLYDNVTYLKDLNERKNAFVGNVSHELKTPLAAIKGFMENLMDQVYGSLNQEQQEVLKLLLHTVDRLNRLVHDLLDLEKIQAGKMTLKMEEVNVAHLIEDVLRTYEVMIKKKEMKIVKKFSPDTPLIIGDKDRLMQVVINLFSNSMKYTPEKGSITIALQGEGLNIRFEIEDNGPGMSKDNLEKIFDKFVRVTQEKREGTGLGLPIARDIVTLHGGRIWAESEEGKGSKFIVVLAKMPHF